MAAMMPAPVAHEMLPGIDVGSQQPGEGTQEAELTAKRKPLPLQKAARILHARQGLWASKEMQKKRCNYVVIACCFGLPPALGVFLAGYRIDGQWFYDFGMDTWYLSSAGLASAMFMIIVPYLGMVSVFDAVARLENHDEVYLNCSLINDVRHLLGERTPPVLGRTRCFRVFRLIVRAIFNISYFT